MSLTADAKWQGIREERLQVEGRSVRLLRSDGREGATTPQLLLHGMGGSSANWMEVIRPLTVHGPVVAVDLPGFGGTELQPGRSANLIADADFVLALVRRLGWSSLVLHGNSTGGLLAAIIAATHPSLVEQLVLVAPSLMLDDATRPFSLSRAHRLAPMSLAVPVLSTASMYCLLASQQETVDLDALTCAAFPDPYVLRPVVLDLLAREADIQARTTGPDALRQAWVSVRSCLEDKVYVNHVLESIAVPTLLLGGRLDPFVLHTTLRHVAARRPDWGYELLSYVGHMPMMEDPAGYVASVVSWSERQRSNAAAAHQTEHAVA